jgi:uncharacterized protein YvpB
MSLNYAVKPSINQIVKQKLQERSRKRLKRKIFATLKSIQHSVAVAVPVMTLVFSSYLAWQVSNYDKKIAGSGEVKAALETTTKKNNSSLSASIKADQPTNSQPETPNQKTLAIPYIKQDYRLSCEATSLQMILSYRGVQKTQDELMQQIGYSEPKVMQEVNGKLIWGDPEIGFVGDVKGSFTGEKDGKKSLRYATGWGVKPGPVARVAKQYFPESKEVTGGTLDQVVQSLSQDKPIIWWHRRDDIQKEKLTYYTPSGKAVEYEQNHVAVISSYKLDEDKKFIFHILDPFYGEYDIKQDDFLRLWARHSNQMVIVG